MFGTKEDIMNREIMQKINSDRIIINLRMQSADLINAKDSLSEEQYQMEAKQIENELDQRIIELLETHR